MEIFEHKFGELVKLHRNAAGITVTQLAKILNVARTVVRNMEHGKHAMRFVEVVRVSKALSIDLNQLLIEIDELNERLPSDVLHEAKFNKLYNKKIK